MIAYSFFHWFLSVWGFAMIVAALLIVAFNLAAGIQRFFRRGLVIDHTETIREMYADVPFEAAAASQVIEHQRKGKP